MSVWWAIMAAAGPNVANGVASTPYGRLPDGRPVERYVLANARGVRVGILTYGGIIDEIAVPDRNGRFANVVLALPDLAAYRARANVGSIVGRYANRIGGGGFAIDGVRYPLSSDPGAVVSHGGNPGFGARLWRATPCRRRGCRSLTLAYDSPDGENGFPGRLHVTVRYALDDHATLTLIYRATTNRPTVVNLTNHSYFALSGDPARGVADQVLRVAASRYAVADLRRLPTGELRAVAGTPFDLRQGARLGDRIGADDPVIAAAHGLDHGFVLDGGAGPAATLSDPASGRTLDVFTSEPSIQVYTAGSFNGSLIGAGGVPLRRGAGVALEAEHLPDSPNRANFPSTVLRPGQRFASTTRLRFGIAPRSIGDAGGGP